MSLLGIDVGTTGCKAVVYAVDGSRLGFGTGTYRVDRTEGRAEVRIAEVESAVAAVVRSALQGSSRDPVSSLCITSMGESFVLVDNDGPVIQNSILGHDSRGQEEIDPIIAELGRDYYYRISGNQPNENYSLAKLLWLARHEKNAYSRAKHFLCWSEYIAFRLGAIPAIGFSHANRTLMFDVREEQWSKTIIQKAGIDTSILPMVLPEGSSIGTVNAAGEDRFGVPKGTIIILGGHDQIFNALGAGCVTSGTAVDGMGTFECITPVYTNPPSHAGLSSIGMNLEHHALSGFFVSFIYNQSGSVAEWFLRTFVKDAPVLGDAFLKMEHEMPSGPARPLFLPLLENSGSPYFISGASGVYEGIKFDTDRGELFKATLEGITFYYLESLYHLGSFGIHLNELSVTGGGSASDKWLQLKADIFGLPVVRLPVKDSGAMGAAMMAGIKTDVYRNAAEAAALYVHPGQRFEPDCKWSDLYKERYELYKTMYSDRADRLKKLSRISGY